MKPEYYTNFVSDDALVNMIIERKLDELDWLNVTEARREYFMSDVERAYTYGKDKGKRTYTSHSYTPEVLAIQEKINNRFNTSYNICFLNRYEDQKQHLGWHADDSPSMDRTHPIAVVSFGVEREIWWKLKEYKGEIPAENRQLLQDGSLFVMPGGFQDYYFHRIPKHDRECGTRISLTFRRYV